MLTEHHETGNASQRHRLAILFLAQLA